LCIIVLTIVVHCSTGTGGAGGKDKTFKPKAGAATTPSATGTTTDLSRTRKTLNGNLKQCVLLPPGEGWNCMMLMIDVVYYLLFKRFVGEDRNEWLAVNTVDFFNQINLLYGSIVEFCTDRTCPIM
jgi:hypothetical protein